MTSNIQPEIEDFPKDTKGLELPRLRPIVNPRKKQWPSALGAIDEIQNFVRFGWEESCDDEGGSHITSATLTCLESPEARRQLVSESTDVLELVHPLRCDILPTRLISRVWGTVDDRGRFADMQMRVGCLVTRSF